MCIRDSPSPAPKRTHIGGAQMTPRNTKPTWPGGEFFLTCAFMMAEMKLSPAYICDVDQCTLNIVDVKNTKNPCVECVTAMTTKYKALLSALLNRKSVRVLVNALPSSLTDAYLAR